MRILDSEVYEIEDGPGRRKEIRERVIAESPLEVEVLRQSIVADKWNLTPEHLESMGQKSYAPPARLLSTGGQAIFHPQFHPGIVVHYRVGDQIVDGFFEGFFELSVGLIDKEKGRQVAEFKLSSCLALLRKPPFQTGWHGSNREFFVCPWWYYFSSKAEPHGVAFKPDVQDWDNGPLFMSSLSAPRGEWDMLPPHMRLIEPGSINHRIYEDS